MSVRTGTRPELQYIIFFRWSRWNKPNYRSQNTLNLSVDFRNIKYILLWWLGWTFVVPSISKEEEPVFFFLKSVQCSSVESYTVCSWFVCFQWNFWWLWGNESLISTLFSTLASVAPCFWGQKFSCKSEPHNLCEPWLSCRCVCAILPWMRNNTVTEDRWIVLPGAWAHLRWDIESSFKCVLPPSGWRGASAEGWC